MTKSEKIQELEKNYITLNEKHNTTLEKIVSLEKTLYWIIRFVVLQMGGLFVLWAAGVLKLK